MKQLLLLSFMFLNNLIFAQTFQLIGVISDNNTGETLIGANIYIPQQGTGVVSNNYGFYSIQLNKKDLPITVKFSYVGYEPQEFLINKAENLTQNIGLNPISLDEVVMKSSDASQNYDLNKVEIPIERLKQVPMLLGEVDVLKALAMTPGVSTGAEGTTGLFVRGGTPDQNLILLDGATVYNAAHLFGFYRYLTQVL